MFQILHSCYFAETYPLEWAAMTEHFSPEQLITEVADVVEGATVFPRYRTVPFGDLLEAEVKDQGGNLINTAEESARIRDLFQWVDLLKDFTAPAYRIEDLPKVPEGSFFVKGETSSLKTRGPQAVFARSKAEAEELAVAISQDDWLRGETPAIRPLQDYRQLGTTPAGLPIFHERRAFIHSGKLLADTFYWGSFMDSLEVPLPELNSKYWQTVEEVATLTSSIAPFLCVDFAEYENGRWGVVELNDACQAGVPAPHRAGDMTTHELYKQLAML